MDALLCAKLFFTGIFATLWTIELTCGVALGSGWSGPVIARRDQKAEDYWAIVGVHIVFGTAILIFVWARF